MSRIVQRFIRLGRERRAGFVPYLMAGDPDPATSLSILKALPAVGADLIEVGFPFSDPMAEGPPIQRAAERALATGMTLAKVLELVAAARASVREIPLVLMGYLNPILAFGVEAFARAAARSGADAVIVVDCPPEESGPLQSALAEAGVSLICLATPTTDAARLAVIAEGTSGFIYYVSVAGVTGGKAADAEAIAPAVAAVRQATGLPVAVGFGVRTEAQAAAVARIADAVVVGSALVDEVAAALDAGRDPAAAVLKRARRLAAAVHGARVAPIAV